MTQKITDIDRAWSVRRKIVVGGILVLVVVGLFSCSLSSNSHPRSHSPTYPHPCSNHRTNLYSATYHYSLTYRHPLNSHPYADYRKCP